VYSRRCRSEGVAEVWVHPVGLVYPSGDLGLCGEVGLVCLGGVVVLGHPSVREKWMICCRVDEWEDWKRY
jgi:hypothetical protein